MKTIRTDKIFEEAKNYFTTFSKEWVEQNCNTTFFNQGFFVGSFIDDRFKIDMSFFPDGDINYIFITLAEKEEISCPHHNISFTDNLSLFNLSKDQIVELLSKVKKHIVNKIDDQQYHYGNVKLTFAGTQLVGIYLLNKEL